MLNLYSGLPYGVDGMDRGQRTNESGRLFDVWRSIGSELSRSLCSLRVLCDLSLLGTKIEIAGGKV
jgi:hypothetical protein